MAIQEQHKVWIESKFPEFWSLLNVKAQRNLPKGLVEYIDDGTLQEIESGKNNLAIIEKYIIELKNKCGTKAVRDTYLRDLSGVNSENQVAELFCEISLCASLAKLTEKLELRPSTGKGTYSDCLFNLCGFDIYGEAKRYVDTWPHIDRIIDSENEKCPYERSISKTSSDEKPNGSVRPRSMDLRSKLRDVHKQFPDHALNILFIFHPLLGESKRYFTQALFGDSNFFNTDSDFVLEDDGLFSIDDWQNISGCCLCRANSDSEVAFISFWINPRAEIKLPMGLCKKLRA